ncbi:MAG: tyrosine protein phosphatase yvh1 [Caeruleum heppii]|nr:MAG: tyrosine protein phosphatase yvh1 [Caeruleum heppii]
MPLDRIPGPEELYIGSIIGLRRRRALDEAGITHIISVYRGPLEYELLSSYKHLHVEVNDLEDDCIIEHFPTINAFIERALLDGGAVLVHCVMGKSRSAACMVAYLMHKHRLTVQEGLAQIRQSRPMCEPNRGFMKQLKLYHKLQCPPDLEANPDFQRWLYQRTVKSSVAHGMAPDQVRFEDEQGRRGGRAREEEEEEEEEGKEVVRELRCRKCRGRDGRSG